MTTFILMATIILNKPALGQHQTVPLNRGASYTLNFPTNQTEVFRHDDNLRFNFADGSSLEVENFYAEYFKENLPEFQVEDRLITGMEFFTAFAPDFAPATCGGASLHDGNSCAYKLNDLARADPL